MKYFDMNTIKVGNMFEDERGLHIRVDAQDLKGLRDLLRIGRGIRRPVETDGNLGDGMAFVWIIIPMKPCSTGIDITNKVSQ